MQDMKKLMAVMAFAALSGCSTYRISSAENHPTMPVLKLETVRMTNALLWVDVEHQFWLCQDRGEELVCERSCGGDVDLQCPQSTHSDGGFTTNTR